MSQIDKLLKYQKADSKLLQLERETNNSEERKNYAQAKSFLTKAPEKLESLDAKARELEGALDSLKKRYAEILETLEEFEHLDELIDEGADIAFYKKNVAQLADKLKAIKGDIAALTRAIKDADEEYRALKKKTIEMQTKYAEASEKYKKLKESKTEEAKSVMSELEELKKGIAPEVLDKYTEKRNERIFPILCPVKNGRCGICGSELSLAGKEKITSGTVTECDNCHRILYNEN